MAGKAHDKATLARNLLWMCECMGYRNLRVAATELGVGYDWLRRAVTQGVGFARGGNTLDDVAKFFGVPKAELWADPPDRLQRAVLAKAKPDHVAHSVALEAVLRHYGIHRPPLLEKCLHVISHYQDKIANPSIDNPEDRFVIIEASASEPPSSRRSPSDYIDREVERRMGQLRLLPKREILEAVVQARIDEERRHDRLIRFRDPKAWEAVKAEIVAMFIHLHTGRNEDGLGEERTAAVTALAERYAQRLWDGEFSSDRRPPPPRQPKPKDRKGETGK